MTSQPPADRLSLKILSAVARLRSALPKRGLLGVALIVFLGSFVYGLLNLPDVETETRWGFIAVSFMVGVPATVLFNALEYVVTARIAGHSVPFRNSVEVSVLASAANLLPIPGAALVRAEAIRRIGGKTGRAVLSTVAAGFAWIAVSGVLAGAGLMFGRAVVLGAVCLGVSLVMGGLAYAVVRRQRAEDARSLILTLVLVEIGSVAVKTFRVWLVITAFGYEVSLDQALVLTLAAVIAVALGFFPGGLGASEILSAIAAPAVDLAAAVGVTASAVDRLITLAGLGVLTGVLWIKKAPPDVPDGEQENSPLPTDLP